MSLYIGPLYFHDRDVFLLLGIILLVAGWTAGVKLPIGELTTLLYIAILFLFIKSYIKSEHEGNLLVLFFSAILLSFFVPMTVIVLFISIGIVLFRLLKLM